MGTPIPLTRWLRLCPQAARRVPLGALMAATMLVGGTSSAALGAAASDTGVVAKAYGYDTDVSLFGGPSSERGPAPQVELDADAANSPQDASVETGTAVYGPAEVFRSGAIDVHAEGSLGSNGSAETSVSIAGNADPEVRPGPFVYDAVATDCTADADGIASNVTIDGGVVETKYDVDTQLPIKTEDVPTNPPEGLTIEGTIDHVGDKYRIVFNEQTSNPDGSLTVNAAHIYLLGDIAVGNVIIGHAVCGHPAAEGASTTGGGGSSEPTSAPSETATPPSTPNATPSSTTPTATESTPTATPSASVAAAPDSNAGDPAAASGSLLPAGAIVAVVVVLLLALGLGVAWRRRSTGGEG